MNILKIQDGLKNLSDEQLAQEMRLPSGTTPQYLVMTEMQRRQKMRDAFSGNQPPKTTMAEEMSGEAPPSPPAGGMPPAGDEANAQGIMGLPDQTMAGGAMRAMISGQPQQVDDMTAMPPQGMAAGGAVQFGNPFAGAQMGTAAPSAGYSPIQQYSPKYYAPEKGTDYGDIKHQFDGAFARSKAVPNPRVYKSDAERYGLPAGMAAPTPGTPGFEKISSGREGGNARYSWSDPSYRDAYIRYMTPPAKTTAPVAKAGGGPIRMFAGGIFDDYNEATPEEVYATMRDSDITDMLRKKTPKIETRFGAFGGNPVTLTREGLLAEVARRNNMNFAERGMKDVGRFLFPYIDTATGAVVGAAKGVASGASGIGNYAFGDIEVPVDTKDIGKAGGAAAGRAAATTPAAAPPATSAIAPQKPAAPPAAAVSGAPKKEAAPATDGGLAALLQQKQDRARAYEERANALLDKQRGDKEELANRDFNAALMQLGLGLAGSKANNLMSGIAEAGLPALQQYTAAREGRRKDEGALTDAELVILGKSNEIAQAEDKAAQDAYEAERKYQIDRQLADIQQQEADTAREYYRERGSSARNPYTAGQIAWARQLEKDILDPVKAMSISEDDKRLAREILFGSGGVGAGGGGADLKFDPATNDFAQ